jgi:hypothetical protein
MRTVSRRSGEARVARLIFLLKVARFFVHKGWTWFADIWRDIRGVPFVIAMMVLIGLLLMSRQGADIVGSATDWNPQTGWLIVSAFVLGLEAWFWTRYIIDEDARRKGKKRADALLLLWLPRVLGAAPLLLSSYAIWKSSAGASSAILIAILVLGLGFLILLWRRRPIIEKLQKKGPNEGLLGDASRLAITSAFQRASWFAAIAALVLVLADPVGSAQFVGPVAVVFFGVALIIPVIAGALHASRDWKLPVIGALVTAAIVFSFFNDNHEIGRRWLQPRFAPIGPAEAVGARASLQKAFETWRGRQPATSGPIPIVFVAAEGGASRAGFWAAETLGKLQEETGGKFSDSVFSISSVSGGSVGATAFVSQLHDDPTPAGFREAVRSAAGDDFLSPALAGLLFPDLVQRFLPVALLPDRAETLERGFEHGWARHCGGRSCDPNLWRTSFLGLWQTPKAPWVPVLMINGTRQEDGARIITSNVQLNPNDFANTVDYLAVNGADIRISTAILNGARFPAVSPGGTIHERQAPPKPPYAASGHVLDGGYYDGGGIATMRDTAQAVMRFAAVDGIQLKPIFIEINNDSDADAASLDLQRNPYKASDTPLFGGSQTHDFLADFLGPLEGLWKSGQARGTTGAVTLAVDVSGHAVACPGNAPKTCVPAVVGQSGPQTLKPWGEAPAYVWLHLCNPPKQPVRVPMDWVLSTEAKNLSRLAAGYGGAPAGCGNDVQFGTLAKALPALNWPANP